MSQSIFPTLITETFIPSLWRFPSGQITAEYLNTNFLKFPISQGSETISSNLSVSGITNLGETNLQTKNSTQNSNHYLNFSDNFSTGVGAIQKSANFVVNPSTGTFSASGLITANGGLTTGSGQVLTSTGTTTLTGATTATGLITANGGLKIKSSNTLTGIACGRVSTAGGTGSVTFGFTFDNIPFVTANIESTSTTTLFNIAINNITTTGFSYSKMYAVGGGVGQATTEPFNWIAIGK